MYWSLLIDCSDHSVDAVSVGGREGNWFLWDNTSHISALSIELLSLTPKDKLWQAKPVSHSLSARDLFIIL